MRPGLHSGADDGEIAGIFAREQTRGQSADCGGPDCCDCGRVDDRQRLTIRTVEGHSALMRILADCRVPGKRKWLSIRIEGFRPIETSASTP